MEESNSSFSERMIFYFAGSALVIMTVIVAANSLSRYILDHPLLIVEEVATAMFVWLIFIGASVCYGQKMHIGIECFVDLLPDKVQRIITVLVDIILLLTNAVLVYLSARLTYLAWSKLTPVLRIPYSFIDVSAVIGFSCMLYYSCVFLISDIKAVTDDQ